MRKWRPIYKCLYVIPEVHGNAKSLEIILNRILPLRFSIGQEDVLILLGDYIDGDSGGAEVIDMLINVKKELGERAIMIRGNHEEMMLRAIFGSKGDFDYWIENDGISTIRSYLEFQKINASPNSIVQSRLRDLVPKNHIEFLQSLEFYKIYEEFLFFHGSFNHEKTIMENSVANFAFDYTASKYTKSKLSKKEIPKYLDKYIYVGAHNYNGNKPFIYQRYLMLSSDEAPNKLYLFELNSMTAAAIKKNKSRIYKYNFKIIE